MKRYYSLMVTWVTGVAGEMLNEWYLPSSYPQTRPPPPPLDERASEKLRALSVLVSFLDVNICWRVVHGKHFGCSPPAPPISCNLWHKDEKISAQKFWHIWGWGRNKDFRPKYSALEHFNDLYAEVVNFLRKSWTISSKTMQFQDELLN